ncbi:hypothetical protein J0664_08605 [Rhizobium leguminosarum]|jgi:hypothetical protein|nr:hypothetical protein J0664_08605 [Rhizobium leguminosarum]
MAEQKMDQTLFTNLCKAGKFKEALGLAIQGHEDEKYTPSRFSIDKKTRLPIFYRGNKRVEPDEEGVWQLAKNPNP